MWRHARPPESARRRVLLLLSRRSVSVVAVQERVRVRDAEAMLLRLSRRRQGRRGGREGGRQLMPPRGCGRRRQALHRAEHLVRVHTRAVDRRAGRGADAGADARARRRSAGAGAEASERRIAVDENDASSAVCVHT